MSIASRAWERLESAGARVHFEAAEPDGRVEAQLRDLGGNLIDRISLAEVLRIAAGGTPRL